MNVFGITVGENKRAAFSPAVGLTGTFFGKIARQNST